MVAARGRCRSVDSDGDLLSCRTPWTQSSSGLHRQHSDHSCPGSVAGAPDQCAADTGGTGACIAAIRRSALARQYSRIRPLVLETRRRRPAPPGQPERPHGRFVPVSPNDAVFKNDRRKTLVPAVHRLSFHSLQYEHRVFPFGYSGSLAMGQSAHDAAVDDFTDHRRAPRVTRNRDPVTRPRRKSRAPAPQGANSLGQCPTCAGESAMLPP